jgi:D-xylose 1-dehydrogenase
MALYPSLKQKRALVTGGATGIGQSIVTILAAQGCKVVFLDANLAAGTALASALNCQFAHCDLTDTPALQALLTSLQKDGGFDVIVNNAARDDRHAIEDVTPAMWDATIAVNIKHYFFVAQALAEGMKQRGGGAIINISSETAFSGHTELSVYGAAKGACISLTRSQARHWGPSNIRVNAVVPGWVRTQRQIDKWITPEAEATQMTKQALKRWIESDDIANMVVFLASDEARSCTAQVFTVDAGTH